MFARLPFWLFLWMNLLHFPLSAQEIPCDGQIYLSTSGSSEFSQFNTIIQTANSFGLNPFTISDPDRRLTCLGYSVFDQYIYGLDFDSKELIRIDRDGNLTVLGIPESLDLDLEYYAGAVSPYGRGLIVIGHNPQMGIDTKLFNIDLQAEDYHAGSVAVVGTPPVALEDLAFDPIYGLMNGFDRLQQQLVSLSTSGALSSYQYETVPYQVKALFFDQEANLYGYNDAYYQFDKFTGEATLLNGAASYLLADACGCPFIFDYTKDIYPARAVPCSEVTVSYNFTNQSGGARSYLLLKDTFPEGFIITEINGLFNSVTINSGVGTNILDLSTLDVILGEGTSDFSLQLYIPEGAEGTYPTQSFLYDLPIAFLDRHPSDNAATLLENDPSVIEVVAPEEIALDNYLSYNCDGDTAVISAPFIGEAYLWNTGAESAEIQVTEEGWYRVEILNDCYTYVDSIYVELPITSLSLDVGADRMITLGESLPLTYTANTEIVSSEWSISPEGRIACPDCASTIAIPNAASTISVTVTDENGCTATDAFQVQVNVDPNVYAPNIFSPNFDGLNDVFYLQGKADFPLRKLQVFNRWGGIVYETKEGQLNQKDHGWDGQFGGRAAPSGVYLWCAEILFPDGSTQLIYGDLLLVGLE